MTAYDNTRFSQFQHVTCDIQCADLGMEVGMSTGDIQASQLSASNIESSSTADYPAWMARTYKPAAASWDPILPYWGGFTLASSSSWGSGSSGQWLQVTCVILAIHICSLQQNQHGYSQFIETLYMMISI